MLAQLARLVRMLLREPLLHFGLLGMLLYAASALVQIQRLPGTQPIRISQADIEQLTAQWRRDAGRAPTSAELEGRIQGLIDQRLLLQEALRRGLDRSDGVVRQRLIRNMRFIDPQTTATDAELLRMARALNMAASDPVVRGRLIQRLQHRIESAASATDGTILAAATEAQWRYSFEHRYFGSGARPANLQPALTMLEAGQGTAQLPGAQPFALGRTFAGQSAAQLNRRFGSTFRAAVQAAEPGHWFGPVLSNYGWHLVRALPPQRVVIDRGPRRRQELQAARERAYLAQAMQALRAEYRIVVEAGELTELSL